MITHTFMNLVINFLFMLSKFLYRVCFECVDALVEFGAQQIVYELTTLVLPGIHRLVLEYQVLGTGVSPRNHRTCKTVSVTDHHPTCASRRKSPGRWCLGRWGSAQAQRRGSAKDSRSQFAPPYLRTAERSPQRPASPFPLLFRV